MDKPPTLDPFAYFIHILLTNGTTRAAFALLPFFVLSCTTCHHLFLPIKSVKGRCEVSNIFHPL